MKIYYLREVEKILILKSRHHDFAIGELFNLVLKLLKDLWQQIDFWLDPTVRFTKKPKIIQILALF